MKEPTFQSLPYPVLVLMATWAIPLQFTHSVAGGVGGMCRHQQQPMSFEEQKKNTPYFHLSLKPMADFTGLRSCTWTEFPAHPAENSSSVTQNSTASSCDLTLLTCLLIGSYRFCIIPLLAVFSGKDKKLLRSK